MGVVFALLGFAVMCAGVVFLTQTAPATMKPTSANDAPGRARDG